MYKVSAVSPRRSAVLTVFRGATAINDGTTAESRRSWRSDCGLCRTRTAVAPRLRCDGASTAEARRNMFNVAAVPPRMSAVLTVFRGATTINDGVTSQESSRARSHRRLSSRRYYKLPVVIIMLILVKHIPDVIYNINAM